MSINTPENINPNAVNILNKTVSGAILVYIFFNQKGVNRTDLTRVIEAAPKTIDSTIKYLKLNHLINEEKLKTFPPEKCFTLTELGLRVAQSLSEIASALQFAVDSVHTSKEPTKQ